jgi:hypothetical protein
MVRTAGCCAIASATSAGFFLTSTTWRLKLDPNKKQAEFTGNHEYQPQKDLLSRVNQQVEKACCRLSNVARMIISIKSIR